MVPMLRADGNRRPTPTIYDIARLAGVSPSTVSRALNQPGRISEDTAQRIRDAATRLGYRSNPAARALPTGRTGTLGLILSDITNPVYFDLLRGAERVCAAEGLTLVFAESQESPDLEDSTAERLLPAVDGLVLVASRLPDDRIAALAAAKPVVLVNRAVAGLPAVVADVVPGLAGAVDHLAGLGHRSLGYLAGPPSSYVNRLRWEALFDLAEARGMSIVEIGPWPPTVDGGRAALRRVLASGVTAALAYNDLIAMGVLHACRERTVAVPGRLSVVGFDDIFGADLLTPALSTIRSPLGDAGEAAVRLLVDPDGAAAPALGTAFVARASTGPPG
jgi:LacI family transcriptional regulator